MTGPCRQGPERRGLLRALLWPAQDLIGTPYRGDYALARAPGRRDRPRSGCRAGPAAGTAADDRAAGSGPHDLGDRAGCCPARPVVRVLIPPAPARPHSADLLLCGHHYRASGAALAVAGAVIMDDRRSGGTSVTEHEPGDLVLSDATPRR